MALATIKIDLESCCGNGMCIAIAPQVFDLDDETGVAFLLNSSVSTQNRAAVQYAIDCCPTAAISIDEASK